MSLFMQQQPHGSHPGHEGAGDGTNSQMTRTLSRQGSSNGSFVCNVSGDEVIERDVDLEIEARMRSETSSSRQSSRSSSSTRNRSTLSQRMLSALQRKKTRAAVEEVRPKRRGSVLLDAIADDEADSQRRSNHSMGADIDGLVVPDPTYDPSQDPVYMSDDDSHIAHMSTRSCKDRLEARISERRQQNKSPLSSRPSSSDDASDVNEMSAMYSIRNTYPAESAKRVDSRFSENLQSSRSEHPHPTRKQRAMPSFPHHPMDNGHMDPTVENLDATKSLPVSFHFQGSASVEHPAPSRNLHSSRLEHSHSAQPRVEPQPSRDDPYTTMRTSVEQIEQVVDGLESLLMAATFSSLAAVALKELELLRESTKQLRTNGTTMILSEIGRPQSKMLGPFRQLVARAASVQSRIELLIDRIKTMV